MAPVGHRSSKPGASAHSWLGSDHGGEDLQGLGCNISFKSTDGACTVQRIHRRSYQVAVAALMITTALAVGCGSSSNYGTPSRSSDGSELDLDPSQTFPEEQRDSTYGDANGSEAEQYCLEINSPDMIACQEAYDNLDGILKD